MICCRRDENRGAHDQAALNIAETSGLLRALGLLENEIKAYQSPEKVRQENGYVQSHSDHYRDIRLMWIERLVEPYQAMIKEMVTAIASCIRQIDILDHKAKYISESGSEVTMSK